VPFEITLQKVSFMAVYWIVARMLYAYYAYAHMHTSGVRVRVPGYPGTQSGYGYPGKRMLILQSHVPQKNTRTP